MENSPQLPGRTERPVPASPAKSSRILEGVSVAVLVGAIVYAVISYVGLPQTVPVHFGPNGEPDSWGSKNEFLQAPIMIFLTTVLCITTARFPRVHNFPLEPATDAGWQALYTCSRNMLLWTSIGIGLVLVEITYSTVHPEKSSFGSLFLLVFILGPLIYYIPKMIKTARLDAN